MSYYFLLPVTFLRFWFIEAPVSLIGFFGSVNSAFDRLFSLTLLFKTFFKPWKNEYRQGLVGFSIGMGMLIKSCVILVDLTLFFLLLFGELITVLLFIFLPIATVYFLFY
ncbi:MAG: hypothetical protein M1524_01370 [Patescibacteria group bacterium]|nr:hypothetical protein [Patescibacteria group bacterium]